MNVLGVVAVMFCLLSQAAAAPVDSVIVQVQQPVVGDGQQTVKQVLLNGLTFTTSHQELNSILQSISADSLTLTLLSVDPTAALKNHTCLRSRECILEKSELHWTDRILCDGEVYVTLDSQGSWTAHVAEAAALKALWDQVAQRSQSGWLHLQEGCMSLMKELRLSEEPAELVLPQFLIPLLSVLAFVGLMIATILLSKRQRLRPSGGVIGSVIHYPKDMAQMSPEMSSGGYHTL